MSLSRLSSFAALAAAVLGVGAGTALGGSESHASIEVGTTACRVDFRSPAANLACSVDVVGGEVSLTGALTVVERIVGPARFGYDARGRLVRADGTGGTRTYAYDADGRVVAMTDSSGHTTRYAYDAHGRLTTAGGARFVYAGEGLVRHEAPGGATTQYSYGEGRDLLTAGDGTGTTGRFAYGADGLVVGASAPGRTIEYTYDQGRPVRRTVDGTTSEYSYDRAGLLRAGSDSRGEIVQYDYDEGGSLVLISSPAGTARFDYAADGRLVQATAPDGRATELVYDDVGRLVAVTPEAGDEVVIAFEHGDARHPYEIGFLWGDGDSVTVTAGGQLRACRRCP